MNLLIILTITLAAVAAVPTLRAATGSGWPTVCNGTHSGPVTRSAESALPLTRTILTAGTAPATQVDVCGATDEPIGWSDENSGDNASADDNVAVALFGAATRTGEATASKAIAAGADLFTAAAGKVTDTAVDTSWLVGKALTAAAADGDVIEFDPRSPVVQSV